MVIPAAGFPGHQTTLTGNTDMSVHHGSTILERTLVLLALGLIACDLQAQGSVVRTFDRLPPLGDNAWYPGNRAPLVQLPLTKLPAGAVKADGWLNHQLELMRDGYTGHLEEISKWCKIDGNAWANASGEGEFGWEEVPYWLRGYIDLAYLVHDQAMITEARRWVDGVLSSQDSSGYFGPRRNKSWPDIWPNMVMLSALRTDYEATHDGRILPFMLRYAKWLAEVPLEFYLPGDWQKWRGGDNLDHLYWLYNQTGEGWLLELARTNHDRTADWTGGIPTWHGVNICQGFREPAEYYQQSGDLRYVRATERIYDSVMNTYGQVPGGMFAADENARPGYVGPRQAAETCSMVEFMHSDQMLSAITGDPAWGDRCEDVAFNSLPASMTPDLKGLHYLTAPNMVQLDKRGKGSMFDNDGDMLSYTPWQYRCCQHNSAIGWPYFTENLWMAVGGNGIAAVVYAPSSVELKVGKGSLLRVTEETDYPFSDEITFRFELPASEDFPFAMRIPGWCRQARVTVNGAPLNVKPVERSWVTVTRKWTSGDKVVLEFPSEVRVNVWTRNRNALSVYRGALAFSLKIGERWEPSGGTAEWSGYEVFPTTPWNYGLLIDGDDPARSFELVRPKGALAAQPFTPDHAPLMLKAHGRRIPAWSLEPNGMIQELSPSPIRCDSPIESITLIPMGCARLRVSSFPRASTSPDANAWK
jgi:hypothetical protein